MRFYYQQARRSWARTYRMSRYDDTPRSKMQTVWNPLKETKQSVLFLGRKRKQFYVWSPLVLQVLHAIFIHSPLYPHDTDPRWLFMSSCGWYPSHDDLTK